VSSSIEVCNSHPLYRLLDGAKIGLVCLTSSGTIHHANTSFCALLSLEPQDLKNTAFCEHVHPEERETVYQTIHSKQISSDNFASQLRMVRRNGSIVWVRFAISFETGCETYLVLVEDISEHRVLEDRLAHSQKIEALGRLAGGVAHDFNNMLTAIRGYSELLLQRIPATDNGRRYAEGILAAAERSAQITHQLLAFSRQQVMNPKVLSVHDVLAGMTELVRRLVGEDIELTTQLSAKNPYVKADRSQLEQVIMNLAVNARDAMPSGGRLLIETGDAELDETYIREHAGSKPGRHAVIRVSDSGVGMEPQVQARIFEPFFTTKSSGKGTGLGLATVYGIVKQSGGCIWVYSEPGQGTTFKIYIPSWEPAGERKGVAPCYGSGEVILVIEDDEPALNMLRQSLLESGYRVLAARSGHEAVVLCEEHRGSVQLLISDLNVPGTNGQDLSGYLAVRYPELRTIFTSGYSESMVRGRVLSPEVTFMEKPLHLPDLLRKIRVLLDLSVLSETRQSKGG
jgi:two-component system, cell cycle sensor histidine kinase and response regulator CckA